MKVYENPALAELQRLRPAKLRVFTRDSDEAKAVAIPANRKKWERLATVLDGLDWLRIEALDARGNITGVVAREDDSADAEVEDVDYGEAERVAPLLTLMLKAQQVVLDRHAASQKPLIDGVAKLVSVLTDSLGTVAGAYRMALAAASSIPGGRAPTGEDDDGVGKFLQFAMMMAMKGGQGTPAAIQAVSAAKAAADARPQTSPDKGRPTPPAGNGVVPGR